MDEQEAVTTFHEVDESASQSVGVFDLLGLGSFLAPPDERIATEGHHGQLAKGHRNLLKPCQDIVQVRLTDFLEIVGDPQRRLRQP